MDNTAPRVAVVTGASSGIGRETARMLAAQGWRVIATGRDAGRDAGRCAAAETEIREASSGAGVTMIRADLALLADAARLAGEIAALTDRIDVLINNAGGMAARLVMTPEGFEENFAGNHLGPFLLTNRLLPLLRAAAADSPAGSVRIINTSSDGSEYIDAINLDDLQNLENWSPGAAYCTGKLANVLHAKALAQRLAADGIVAHAVHPGTANSNFFANLPPETAAYTATLAKMPVAESADTLLWLASGEEAGRCTGQYWYYHRQLKSPNPLAEDQAVIDRCWEESEKLVARAGV